MSITKTIRISNQKIWKDQLQKLEQENKVLQLNIKNTSKLHQQSMDLIENIQEEPTKQQKDTRTARNDYKHSQEVLNKLQTEYNQLQEENKKYIYCIAQIQKMSLLERLLNKYPEEIKELKEKNI